MEPWRPLYAISQSYGRVSELVEYLSGEGIDAYDVEERRCKRNADLRRVSWKGKNLKEPQMVWMKMK